MFAVRADPKNARFLRLLEELPARFEAAQRLLAYSVAQEARRQVLKRIPTSPDYKPLRESLEIVRGASKRDVVFALRARPRSAAVSKLDVKKDVVYVTPKRRLGRVPEEIRVLEVFSPWPVDMLPFAPDPRFAVLVHRKVSVPEVMRLRKKREADKPRWRQALAKAGVTGAEQKRPDLGSQRSVPDMVFQSLNLEFGLGSEGSPHWRPAIREARKPGFLRKVVESPKFQKTLTDPQFRQWRAWQSGLAESSEPLSEIAKYRAFEDKLGIT